MSQTPLSSVGASSRDGTLAPIGSCAGKLGATAASPNPCDLFSRELARALADAITVSDQQHDDVSSTGSWRVLGNPISCDRSTDNSEPLSPIHVVKPEWTCSSGVERASPKVTTLMESTPLICDTTGSVRAMIGWLARCAVELVARRQRARLRLESVELGAVYVDLFVHGSSVHLGLEGPSAAMAAIWSETHALDDDLARRGLRLAGVSVRARGE